jgi:hypothetical protein
LPELPPIAAAEEQEEAITPRAGRKRSTDDKAKKGKDDLLPRAPPTERERYRLLKRGAGDRKKKEKIQKVFLSFPLFPFIFEFARARGRTLGLS